MKLYFGNAVTAATTLMLLALLGFIGWSVWGRAVIQYWGRRSGLLIKNISSSVGTAWYENIMLFLFCYIPVRNLFYR